jgi:hypothetical protein
LRGTLINVTADLQAFWSGQVVCSMEPEQLMIGRLVAVCAERAWMVVVVAIVFGAAIAYYIVAHFAMSTDTEALLSPELDWRARETAFDAAFPHAGSSIVVVIDGETPELSEAAAVRLADHLSARPELFHRVERPDAGPFW